MVNPSALILLLVAVGVGLTYRASAVAPVLTVVDAPVLPLIDEVSTGAFQSFPPPSVVMAGPFAFSAAHTSVYAARADGPATGASRRASFQDSVGATVSLMWAHCPNDPAAPCSVVAIANNVVALYRVNASGVWRAGTFAADNTRFQPSTAIEPPRVTTAPVAFVPPPFPTPDGHGSMFVLGTTALSRVGATYPSAIVYAFDYSNLAVVWQTTLDADTANFQTAGCATFAWIVATNRSNNHAQLRKLFLTNGSMLAGWSHAFPMGISQGTVGGVAVGNGQFACYGITTWREAAVHIGWANGTSIAKVSLGSANALQLTLVANRTWFAVGAPFLFALDSYTLVRDSVALSDRTVALSVCATVDAGRVAFVVGSSQLYVMENVSGVQSPPMALPAVQLRPVTFPTSPAAFCTGIRFVPSTPDDLVAVSVAQVDSNGAVSIGLVLLVNIASATVVAQAAANVGPYGPAALDETGQRLYVANTQGDAFLKGFQMPPPNASPTNRSMVQVVSPVMPPYQFIACRNASNRSTYFVLADGVVRVRDADGARAERLCDTSDAALTSRPSVMASWIVGPYLVFTYGAPILFLDSRTNELTKVAVPNCATIVATAHAVYNHTNVVVACATSTHVVHVPSQSFVRHIHHADYGRSTVFVVDDLLLMSFRTRLACFNLADSSSPDVPRYVIALGSLVGSPELRPSSNVVVAVERGSDGADVPVAYFVDRRPAPRCLIQMVLCRLDVRLGVVTVVVDALQFHTNDRYATFANSLWISLAVKLGGVFGNGVLYMVSAPSNVGETDPLSVGFRAYNTTSWALRFYLGGYSTQLSLNTPIYVADNGAVAFFAKYGEIAFFDGLNGTEVGTSPAAPKAQANVQFNGRTMSFHDPYNRYVDTVNVYSGTLLSRTSYGAGSVAAFTTHDGAHDPSTANTTTIVGLTQDGVLFATEFNAGVSSHFAGNGTPVEPLPTAPAGGCPPSDSSLGFLGYVGIGAGVGCAVAAVAGFIAFKQLRRATPVEPVASADAGASAGGNGQSYGTLNDPTSDHHHSSSVNAPPQHTFDLSPPQHTFDLSPSQPVDLYQSNRQTNEPYPSAPDHSSNLYASHGPSPPQPVDPYQSNRYATPPMAREEP